MSEWTGLGMLTRGAKVQGGKYGASCGLSSRCLISYTKIRKDGHPWSKQYLKTRVLKLPALQVKIKQIQIWLLVLAGDLNKEFSPIIHGHTISLLS